MADGCRLTTDDNPYDPFTQFNHWFLFDAEKGYNTPAYLARIAKIDDTMTDDEKEIETERQTLRRLPFPFQEGRNAL